MITVSEFNENIADKLHGTTLDSVWNYKGLVKQAISRVLSRVDPPETKADVKIDEGIINGVSRYTAPSDLKLNKVIKIYKSTQDCRGNNCIYEDPTVVSPQSVNDYYGKSVTVDNTNGVKSIEVNNNFLTGCNCDTCTKALIHSMDTFDCDFCSDKGCPPKIKCTSICNPCQDEETCDKCPLWNTTGVATNLNIDCKNYQTGRGSINVDLKNCTKTNSRGSVIISELCPHSITCYTCGYYVLNANICGARDLISMKMRYGSGSLDFHEIELNNFTEGWQYLKFSLDKSTTLGFPNLDQITWYEVVMTTNGNDVNVKLDSLFLSKECAYNIVYYRDTVFKNSAGDYMKIYTSESDILALEDDTVNLVTYELMLLVSQSLQGGDSSSDVNFYSALLRDEYANYFANHKSEVAPIIHYYA